MKDKTIKIDTGFYKKTVNKDQFVKKWLDHVQEVGSLVDKMTIGQLKKFEDFEMFVKELAEKQFEKSYNDQKRWKIQNKKEAV
jgi:hypothetical protein